ncbi:aldose 1-epimerase family protein [Sphingomonas sp. CGMCC 1.13654]|uniref:Aldose 1-epimerase family protein n=1 Tax=Sphingomonas chungangi TaxID=2683589 RepID=A0A838LED6_9SPHN|nr:aldose 1-epimerase family protein [Sphingomonas chungangi]MBA2936496.1 aldose 1-epimerase family protein [Sphingomonas chungangi]MVW55881.1 aldose 1-epimerase family protein [Sphingomonas chungangi]
MITLRSTELEVTISEIGAELQSIRDIQGHDWLWDGDERWWTGRAPLLFPTVGMMANGVARFGGREFAMPKHGFARKKPFAVIETLDHSATFRLEDSDDTRAVYPFTFRLDVTHRLDGAVLETVATVTNIGDAPMPAGFGFHPALRWPLPGTGGNSKTQHLLRFDAEEPEPIRGVTPDGLIGPPARTPIDGDELQLHDSLFEHDALVLDRPNSRGLWYGVPEHPGVRVDFAGLNYLGIWMKPGAGYLCIEPWASHADDEGFHGEFAEKPCVVTLAPGETHDFAMAMTFGVPF